MLAAIPAASKNEEIAHLNETILAFAKARFPAADASFVHEETETVETPKPGTQRHGVRLAENKPILGQISEAFHPGTSLEAMRRKPARRKRGKTTTERARNSRDW
jgi:hypothetical protein